MDRVTCRYIKRDSSICGGICTRTTGCARHWKLYEKNLKKRPCLVCGFPTDADSGYCAKYCSKYSAKYHAMNYRIRQKYGAEALQSGILSELSAEEEGIYSEDKSSSEILYKIMEEDLSSNE
ncbi:unnamed protein product [Rhizophagus irregularis]|nr:unnamed protein product [Rhizophagus irregularis]